MTELTKQERRKILDDLLRNRNIPAGKCGECGSNRIWHDNENYGCVSCGAFKPKIN